VRDGLRRSGPSIWRATLVALKRLDSSIVPSRPLKKSLASGLGL
jgi:hypothetical protein